MEQDYERISYIDGKLHIKCRVCDRIRPEEQFHKNKNNIYGRVYRCNDCSTKDYKTHRYGVTLETANEVYSSTAKEILISMGYDVNGDIHAQFLKRMKDKGRQI